MNGWAFLVILAVGLLGLYLIVAEPTTVYVIYGADRSRPLRVGINDDDDWDRHHFRTCIRPSCRSRVCKYKHGRDAGAQSWRWTRDVHWAERPKRWPALRRRHRVLYIPCPTLGVALWIEDRLLAHYQPPYNVHGVRRENRAPKESHRAA